MNKQEFWDWFEQNRPALEAFIAGGQQDYAIYEALSTKLTQFNELLIPEVTMDEQGHFVLVISCDGNLNGIPAVEQLTDGVTGPANWTVVKYRQAGPMEFIPLNGYKVRRNDILLIWELTNNEKYRLTFYKRWFYPKRIFELGAILHLDHTIGEYKAMMKVEGVTFKKFRLFQSKEGLRTLDDLKAEIDAASISSFGG